MILPRAALSDEEITLSFVVGCISSLFTHAPKDKIRMPVIIKLKIFLKIITLYYSCLIGVLL